MEPIVRTSDYYFSKIREVLQFTYLRKSMTFHKLICSLSILEDLRLSTNLLVKLGLLFYNNLLYERITGTCYSDFIKAI